MKIPRCAVLVGFAIQLLLIARGVTPTELVQQAYLKNSQNREFQEFGASVAVSGETVVVGAPRDFNVRAPFDQQSVMEGAAYVFVREGANWVEQARLKVSDADQSHLRRIDFGRSVAISQDTIVVGAPLEFRNGIDNASECGAVYVFTRTGTTWTQEQRLRAFNRDKGDRFGASVGIYGNYVIVGAPGESSNATGVDGDGGNNDLSGSGAAYVYKRVGTTWTHDAFLKARNPGESFGFGAAVAISGGVAVVGSPWELIEDVTGYGAAYTFAVNFSTGVWADRGYLKPSSSSEANFGMAVAIDGGAVAVGCYRGGAHVFVPTSTDWSLQALLTASNFEADDLFSSSLAISGNVLVVGAPLEAGNGRGINPEPDAQSNNSMPEAGAAYIFKRAGTSWSQTAYLKASNSDAGDRFGIVGVSGDIIAVGATKEDGGAFQINGDQGSNAELDAGAAYIFATLIIPPTGLVIDAPPLDYSLFGGAVVVAPEATFTASDSINWQDGRLEVKIPQFSNTGEKLTVRNTGPISVVGSDVLYNGVVFASIAPPQLWTLQVIFKASADAVKIQALIRSVFYQNTDLPDRNAINVTSRNATFKVQDATTLYGSASRLIQYPTLVSLEAELDRFVGFGQKFSLPLTGVFSNGERKTLSRFGVGVEYCPALVEVQDEGNQEPGLFAFRAAEAAVGGERCAVFFRVGGVEAMTAVYIAEDCFLTKLMLFAFNMSPLSARKLNTSAPLSVGSFYTLEMLMNQTAEGRRLASLYRQHSRELIEIVDANPSLRDAAIQTLKNFQPAVNVLITGKGTEFQITQAMVDQLDLAWTSLANAAGPALKVVMETERNRFNGFASFVGKNFSEWAGMLQVPAPTQPLVQALKSVKREGQFTMEATYLPDMNFSLWKTAQVEGGVWQPVSDATVHIDPFGVVLTDPNAAGPAFFYKVGAQEAVNASKK